MNILAINYGVHDASACILKDGVVKSYYKEERLTGIKRDTEPKLAIKSCLDDFAEKIDYAAVISYPDATPYIRMTSKLANLDLKHIYEYSFYHHLCHSSLAFYNSGFQDSIVIVVDGQGSIYKDSLTESETVYYVKKPNSFECLIRNLSVNKEHSFFKMETGAEEVVHKHSKYECFINPDEGGIVNVYNTATVLISQSVLENGKTMGLSSYGEETNYPEFFDENSQANWNLFTETGCQQRLFKDHTDKVVKELTKSNYKFYADYAYAVQVQTQEAVGNLIQKAIEKTQCKNVCVVGGYGMNIVANYYYTQRFPEINFYFEPNADDGGLSIGAAMHLYHQKIKDDTYRPLTTTSFHGKKYDVTSYKETTTSIKDIAKILANNESVAVYTGYAESGQRALGNRSILFNALHPKAKDIVNEIKKREWYRPFAGIILEEDSPDYFEMGNIQSSPWMTISFPVKTDIIPGITHVDNTCRIQTVSENDGYLFELLTEFKKLTGYGIILNTSFNLAGDPLVETPEDAFRTLYNSKLDYLWFQETNQLFKNKKLKLIYS
jgi:carbamoyltransferase